MHTPKLTAPHLMIAALAFIGLGAAAMEPQGASIVQTKHNLSTSGPGPFKAQVESRICVFCHTPHRARAAAPLWNREDSTQTYLTYSSSTFGGLGGQPTGDSKLCLSCHDGSIALGAVISEPGGIQMNPGYTHLDSGPGLLGTNLADDHPISFDYQSSKGGTSTEYLPPASMMPPVHLDQAGDVQCTTCHEPHDDSLGNFLVATTRYSQLCTACHQPNGWLMTPHASSTATWNGQGNDPWPNADYSTVSENGCANCHMVHGAPHSERLLNTSQEEQTCLPCHGGQVAQKNVELEFSKLSRHPIALTSGVHDPAEDPLAMTRHVECQDCHDPHAARPGGAMPPFVPGPLIGVPGINSAGQPVAEISAEYELCYKCHADSPGSTSYVPRLFQQLNTRLEFDPSNPSFHPIEAPGKGSFVPSLLPPLTTASLITCQDCHQSSDSPDFGGGGPAGPHGSSYKPLLGRYLNINDGQMESSSQYALCYGCHSRQSILGNESFPQHNKHVRMKRIACTACHDPHGVSSLQANSTNGSHMINFDMRVVSPSKKTGQLYFKDTGFRSGECALTCHGKDHNPKTY